MGLKHIKESADYMFKTYGKDESLEMLSKLIKEKKDDVAKETKHLKRFKEIKRYILLKR